MAEKKDIIEELAFSSDRISDQVRTVALSIIAFVWLLTIGSEDTPVLPKQPDKNLLMIAGALCLVALFVDYLQYLAGYFNTLGVLRAGEGNTTDFRYDKTSFLYRARTALFWLKQVLVVIAFSVLAYELATVIFGLSSSTASA